MKYFLIQMTPDGLNFIEGDEKDVQGYLSDRMELNEDIDFDEDIDRGGIRIIKGELVTPKPAEVVKSWKL